MFEILFTTPLTALISIMALMGVTLHDTKFDKLATTLITVPYMSSGDNNSKAMTVDQSAHTHVERVHLSDIHASQPRLAVRSDHKKHMLQKSVPRGHHSFDGYNLPI